MLLVEWAEELFSTRGWVFLFDTTSDNIHAVFGSALVIDGEGSNKDGHLEAEIDHNAQTCDQTEILKSWHIRCKTNKECN